MLIYKHPALERTYRYPSPQQQAGAQHRHMLVAINICSETSRLLCADLAALMKCPQASKQMHTPTVHNSSAQDMRHHHALVCEHTCTVTQYLLL